MRKALPIVLLAAAATSSAGASDRPAPTTDQEIARITKGASPGKPTSCINQSFVSTSQRIPGAMIYRQGRTWYVNRLGDTCSLAPTDILITSTPSTQLCRGDVARIIESQSRIPKGSCIFGDFIPYQRAR